MTLSVIGAGFGRMGTLSLKLALEQLGLAPCHHMTEVFAHPEQAKVWYAAARGEVVDWDALLKTYKSLVDWPGCHFWRELAVHYPDAKVVLSTRDHERWFESMTNTIFKVTGGRLPPVGPARDVAEMAAYVVRDRTFGGNLDKAHVLDVLAKHEAEVKRSIPAEHLLVFNVAEGWDPLCRFLDVSVPETSFPRTNSTEEFQAMMR